MHIKRDNVQKRRGHAEQQIRATLNEKSSTNKALTEHTANSRHALFHFTERYEHATSETNIKELNRTSRWYQSLVPCFTDQMGSLPIRYTFSHIWLKQNDTFFFNIYIFIFIYMIYHSKDKMKTFKTTPVHLLHTIGSQKYFGHFCVSTNSSISL